jgi:hypothetical protein
MRFFVAAALALVVLQPAAGHAQNEPSEVTDKEIARYKTRAKEACMQPGLARGDPQDKVEAFCSCMVDTLNKSMSRSEWQQAYFYSLKQQAENERRVVAPHLAKLDACRPKP